MSKKNCPSRDELILFPAGELSEEKKNTLELHLAECAGCRRNLAANFFEKNADAETYAAPDFLKEQVKNFREKDSSPESGEQTARAAPSFWQKFFSLRTAFAAALLVCVCVAGFYVLRFQPADSPDEVFRQGTSTTNTPQLLSPAENAIVSEEQIEFRWSAVPDAKNYTLVISDEKGDIITEIPAGKTNVEISVSALVLIPEKTYYWHIKAKLNDGSVSESENRKFSVKLRR